MEKNFEWIPFLEESIPKNVQGYKVTSYAIALEAWRRGITVKFINRGRRIARMRYSLKYKGKEHIFGGSRGDKVSNEAVKICMDKHLTKKHLKQANIPTPEGEMFNENNSDEEIIEYARELDFPLVIKPTDGKGGNGVIANIKNEKDFKIALSYVKDELNYQNIIVEKFFTGKDYRVYVLGDKVIGAFDRIPANVIGDGKSSIKQLLEYKNKERDKNPALYNNPIKVDKETYNLLEASGYNLDSIPAKGERVYLKTKSNVSSGGDSIDVTDKMTKEIKKIAIRASQAIPGLVQSGVDIIVNEENDTGAILEINSRPSIRNHLFPMEGKARDIPKAIIDYYFPETVNQYINDGTPYYFDFQSIINIFHTGHAREVLIPDIPQGEVMATRFIIKGSKLGDDYKKWILRRAQRYNLDGYVKKTKDGDMSVVVSGQKDSIRKFRFVIKNRTPKTVKVESVIEKVRKSPIQIGFEIQKDSKLDSKKAININEYNKLTNELSFYKEQCKKLQNSSSWKLTSPFRKLRNLIKG